ncbi:MAG: hypothetical protein ACO4AV_16340, partial [bacterium]
MKNRSHGLVDSAISYWTALQRLHNLHGKSADKVPTLPLQMQGTNDMLFTFAGTPMAFIPL